MASSHNVHNVSPTPTPRAPPSANNRSDDDVRPQQSTTSVLKRRHQSLIHAFSHRIGNDHHLSTPQQPQKKTSMLGERTPDLLRRVFLHRKDPRRKMSEAPKPSTDILLLNGGSTSGSTEETSGGATGIGGDPTKQMALRLDSVTITDYNQMVTDDLLDKWEPTSRQRDILKRTWSDDFDFLYELGSSIYIHIFESAPRAKELFPSVAQHGDRWKESKEFRTQALKFVQIISQTVKHVYHMDRLVPLLYNVGRAHVRFAKRGFEPEYWDVFQEAMEAAISERLAKSEALTSEEERLEAMAVWRIVAEYIVYKMRLGYMDGLVKAKASGDNSSSVKQPQR